MLFVELKTAVSVVEGADEPTQLVPVFQSAGGVVVPFQVTLPACATEIATNAAIAAAKRNRTERNRERREDRGFFIPFGSDTPKLASALFDALLNSYS